MLFILGFFCGVATPVVLVLFVGRLFDREAGLTKGRFTGVE